jgi:hypothetical protein
MPAVEHASLPHYQPKVLFQLRKEIERLKEKRRSLPVLMKPDVSDGAKLSPQLIFAAVGLLVFIVGILVGKLNLVSSK